MKSFTALRSLSQATSRPTLQNNIRLRTSSVPLAKQARFSVSAHRRSQEAGSSTPELDTAQKGNTTATIGTVKRLPEFSLADKVVCVSGAARGLGLVQAEALLEAGATGQSLILSHHITSKLNIHNKSTPSTASQNPLQISPGSKSAPKKNSAPH
jgi:hypothetical protein